MKASIGASHKSKCAQDGRGKCIGVCRSDQVRHCRLFILFVSFSYIKYAIKYCYKLLFSEVGLGYFNYAVLQKIDFFYFLETFILGTLFHPGCCHLLLTRHDTLLQNDVFTQNSIMRAIIEVSGCNQTHPKSSSAPGMKTRLNPFIPFPILFSF